MKQIFFKQNDELQLMNDDELTTYCRSLYDLLKSHKEDKEIETEVAYTMREVQLRELRKKIDDEYNSNIKNFNDAEDLAYSTLPEFDQNSNYEFVKLHEYMCNLQRSN